MTKTAFLGMKCKAKRSKKNPTAIEKKPFCSVIRQQRQEETGACCVSTIERDGRARLRGLSLDVVHYRSSERICNAEHNREIAGNLVGSIEVFDDLKNRRHKRQTFYRLCLTLL